jgi:hypothetical protein
MAGFFFRRILFPIILWFLIVALSTTLIPAEYADFRFLPAIVYTIVVVYWWLTSLARWLVRRWRWVTVAYLLTNFAVGVALMGGFFAASLALAHYDQRLSVVAGLVGLIAGPGWLIYSIIHLLRYGQRRRKGILWRLLADWLEQVTEEPARTKQSPAPAKKQKATQEPRRTAPTTRTPSSSPATRAAPSKPIYTSVGAGGDRAPAAGVAIPPRATSQRLVGNDPQEFVRQAQEWALRQEYVGNYVPFEATAPTYRQMSFEQEQWYFYWRTQLRQGKFLATDQSYLLVYVYELLNLAGVNSPTDARDRLVTFWQFYRGLQPKLDGYLVDWVADFGILQELPESPLAWYAHALSVGAASRNTETLQLEAWHQEGRDYSALPSNALYELAGYATQQNKFYQSYQKELGLDDALKRGVEVIDQYVQQSQRLSLYELHLPTPTQTVVRLPLQGAIHLYPSRPLVIGRVRPWLTEATLKNDLKAILRYTENILRTQANFKTKLRGIVISSAWASVLDQAFVKVIPKRVVNIDLAGAAALQRESDELRQRLLKAEDATAPEGEATLSSVEAQLLPVAEKAAVSSGDLSHIQRPANTPDGLLTDLPSLAAILGNGNSEGIALLRSLRDHNWQSTPTNLNVGGKNNFVSVLYDQINERALTELGDALIFIEGDEWVVAEDYRDEITYLLDHPDFAVSLPATHSVPLQAEVTSSEGGQLDLIPAGWEEFVRRMQSSNWATLAIVAEQAEVMAKLEALARSHYVTANQLLDQTNEIGLDTVGDNLIDVATTPPQIIDEYSEPLRALLLWAKENEQIEGLP